MPRFSLKVLYYSIPDWRGAQWRVERERFVCCFLSFLVNMASMGRSQDDIWLIVGNNVSQCCPSEIAIEVFGSGCFVNTSKMNMGVSYCYLPPVKLICSWAVVLLTSLTCVRVFVMVSWVQAVCFLLFTHYRLQLIWLLPQTQSFRNTIRCRY